MLPILEIAHHSPLECRQRLFPLHEGRVQIDLWDAEGGYYLNGTYYGGKNLLAVGGAVQAQDRNLGRNLAAQCANCHGTQGQARGDMKPLAGLPAERIVAAFKDFKSGKQAATVMHQISKGYTDAQVEQLATYFSVQKK